MRRPPFALFAPLALALALAACAPADPADGELPASPDAASDGALPDGEPPARGGPMPTDGAVVQQGVGSVLLTLAGEVEDSGGPVDSPGDRIELVLLDGDGAAIETHSAAVTLYPIAGPWRQRAWWPSEARPAAAIVRLWRGDALTLEVDVADIATVPLADGHCDPTGFADRCPGERACFTRGSAFVARPGLAADARPPVGGHCRPLALTVWRHDDVMLLDARADDPGQGALALVGGRTAEGFEAADLRARHGESWRSFGYIRLPPPPAIDLFVGPHLFAPATPVDARPVRARGEGCDPARLIDRCVEGTACGPEDTCRTISAPTLDRVTGVISADGALGLTFEGRDAEDDVEALLIDVLDADGGLMQRYDGYFSWSARPNRFLSVAYEGFVEQADGAFAGQYTLVDDRWPAPAARVRLAAEDAEGLIGEVVDVALGAPAPVRRAANQPCDPFEVLDTCPAGTFCDRPDGADGPTTCLTPPAECPLELPVLDGEYRGDNGPAPDATQASCTFSRGNIGNEQGHAFTAARAGVHRFTVADPEALSAGYTLATLFVRRHCALPRRDDSEIACAHVSDPDQGPGALTLDVELTAGETVYVFVEAPWTGGGPYTLAVEAP